MGGRRLKGCKPESVRRGGGEGAHLGASKLGPTALDLRSDAAGLVCAGGQQAAAVHSPAHVHDGAIVAPQGMPRLPPNPPLRFCTIHAVLMTSEIA